jgi:hypothetical protein
VTHPITLNYRSISIVIVSTSWAVDEYADELSPRSTGQNSKVESKLREKFPPISSERREYDVPRIVTDVNGKACTWYLPGALSTERKVRARTAG